MSPAIASGRIEAEHFDLGGEGIAYHDVDAASIGQYFHLKGVRLEAGACVMRLDFDSDVDKTGWLFGLNYIDVERSTAAGIGDKPAPLVYGPARLTVFDARGRQVRVLADESMPAGRHTVSWNGTDDGGRLLASGVYFHRLETAEGVRMGKMILVK